MSHDLQRPVPAPNADTRPYWEGAKRGELMYQRCEACGAAQFPPRGHCARCQAGRPSWRASVGLGSIHAFTRVERAPSPAFRSAVPYAIALVDFDEGFRLLMNVRGAPPRPLEIGQRVRVWFETLSDGSLLPQVEALESGTSD